MQPQNTQPLSGLIGDVVDQFGRLVRSETRLAQAEVSEKIAEAARGIAYVAAAAILMIPAAVMLLLTLATFLIQMGIKAVLAYLLAALVGCAVSIAFGVVGLGRLKPSILG